MLRNIATALALLLVLADRHVGAQTLCSTRDAAVAAKMATLRSPSGYVTSAKMKALIAEYAALRAASCIVPDVPVLPLPPEVVASPNLTRIPPATRIIDLQGAIWTLNGTLILRNGVSVASGVGSILAWCGGTIYTLGSDFAWYRFVAGSWDRLTAADPCGVAPPPVQPPPPVVTPPVPAGSTVTLAWDLPSGPVPVTGYDVALDGAVPVAVPLTACDVTRCTYTTPTVLAGVHVATVRARNGTAVSPPASVTWTQP